MLREAPGHAVEESLFDCATGTPAACASAAGTPAAAQTAPPSFCSAPPAVACVAAASPFRRAPLLCHEAPPSITCAAVNPSFRAKCAGSTPSVFAPFANTPAHAVEESLFDCATG